MNKQPLPKLPYNIYWINLERRNDRRIHMENILINNKENNFRINAVDYKNNFYPYKIIKHSKLNNGEHGCISSHIIALYTFISTTNDKYCFICEDDLDNPYSIFWKEEHYYLLGNSEYDILQLQTTSNKYNYSNKTINPQKICDTGATIYRIHRNIAKKIIDNHFDKDKNIINVSNHHFPVADVLVYNYGITYLIPMFSYLDVKDSETNANNKNMNNYWNNYFQNAKNKYLQMWKNC
jgi:hypothetical protein